MTPSFTTFVRRLVCQPVALLLLILVGCSLTAAYQCPANCECNEALSHAKCTSLDGFAGIEKNLPISSLDLSNLGVERLTSQLEKLKNLTELNLSGNRLSEVKRLNKRIKNLDLSYNRITSGKLRKIPQSVQKLNLSHNDITYLPLELMKLTQLKMVELTGNPINCTCDTLHVRNWLTQKHVWSDKHIKCMSPPEYKGRPWLQVKQANVCGGVRTVGAHTSYNWDDDDNDLMMGDQPEMGSGHQLSLEDDDDSNTFLPVKLEKTTEKPKSVEEVPVPVAVDEDEYSDESSGDDEEPPVEAPLEVPAVRQVAVDLDNVEGSGSVFENVTQAASLEEDYSEADDDEGSGGPILVGIHRNVEVSSESAPSSENPISIGDEDDDGDEEYPISAPEEAVTEIGIFAGGRSAVQEQTVLVKKVEDIEGGVSTAAPAIDANEDPRGAGRDGETTADAATEPTVVKGGAAGVSEESNTSTYILLAALGIILVCLILFVACKRKDGNNRNRSDKSDVEKARSTELQNMDRRNPGKPLEKKNGVPEFVPLIDRAQQKPANGGTAPEKEKKQSDDVAESKPLLSSFKPIVEHEEPNHQPNDSNNNPNGNVPNGSASPQASPRSTLPGVHQSPASLLIPDNNDDDVFMPASEMQPTPKRYSPIYSPRTPKSDRYSPVYSPETGRVKIKALETPKPKTPILVTRSRSRAGEFITTTETNPV